MARIEERDHESEGRGALTGRALKEVAADEVVVFNLDYDRIIDMEQSQRLDRIYEDAREYAFELMRHVMERANQRYGGSTSQGDEIGIRPIRPADMETNPANPNTVATGFLHMFDKTWAVLGDQDCFGSALNPVNCRDNADAEALYILAWSTDHPAPKTESIQGRKFNRDFFVQPLPWDQIAEERGNLKVIEASPQHVIFAGEDLEINVVVTTVGTDHIRPVGVFVAPGTLLRTAVPDETL